MAERSQSSVWENVRASNAKMAQNLSAPEAAQLSAITSYAKVFSSAPVAKAVAQYGGLEGEHTMLRELQAKGAVGVVVAIDGEVVWADIFASTDLLAKYWPKLLRSYVAEAMTSGQSSRLSTVQAAQSYVNQLSGGREVIETDPGVFRRADITGCPHRQDAAVDIQHSLICRPESCSALVSEIEAEVLRPVTVRVSASIEDFVLSRQISIVIPATELLLEPSRGTCTGGAVQTRTADLLQVKLTARPTLPSRVFQSLQPRLGSNSGPFKRASNDSFQEAIS
jgi:hypothetical protein